MSPWSVYVMAEPSAAELRATLRRVVPELARESIALHPEAKRADPTWALG